MNVSVITVTWNSAKCIVAQIRSVRAACVGLLFEHIMVDNASSDDTVRLIRQEATVSLTQNEKNIGFAAANNQAAQNAKGEFFLFLNPDMELAPGTIAPWLVWMKDHPQIGVAGCRLTDTNGAFNLATAPRRFPALADQLLLLLKLPHLFPTLLDRYRLRDLNPTQKQAVDSVHGSCMLVRRELIEKLGRAFDERYFIWFEDVDLCREAKRLGYTVMYTPVVSAVDLVGQSFARRDAMWVQRQFTRSLLTYFHKWQPAWQGLVLAAARPVGLFLSWLRARLI